MCTHTNFRNCSIQVANKGPYPRQHGAHGVTSARSFSVALIKTFQLYKPHKNKTLALALPTELRGNTIQVDILYSGSKQVSNSWSRVTSCCVVQPDIERDEWGGEGEQREMVLGEIEYTRRIMPVSRSRIYKHTPTVTYTRAHWWRIPNEWELTRDTGGGKKGRS